MTDPGTPASSPHSETPDSGSARAKPTTSAPPRPTSSIWKIALSIAAVSLLATVGIRWSQGTRLQRLNSDAIQAAWDRWTALDLNDYRLRVEQEGRWSHQLQVEVSGGVLVAAQRDGVELPLERLPRAWTVDGLFDTLMADVALNAAAERGDSGGRFVKMLGNLDPETGVPLRYLRIEMTKRGGNPTAGWQVLEFTRLDQSAAQAETDGSEETEGSEGK